MSIALSHTIGADTIQVRSAGLPTATGGIALCFALNDGPMTFTLTDEEARRVVAQIDRQLAGAGVRVRG